jgi:hypothetical protein
MAAVTRPLLLGAALVALAGCGGGGGVSMPTPSQPQPALSIEEQVGAMFAMAFRQSNNAEPIEPAPGAAGELSLTAEPREPN